MGSKSHQKVSKQIELEKKEKYCRNDYQKAIWDLAKKHGLCGSVGEFWTFLSGFDACLELKLKDIEKFKKLK